MDKNILVVDFGFSFIKVYYRGKLIKEPSIFSIDFNNNKDNLVSTNNSNIYTYEGKPMVVGTDAEKKKMKIISRDVSFIFRFYPLAIYHILKKLNIKTEKLDAIAIGLPPENLTKENAEELKKRIISTQINDEKIKIPKSKIFVLGQGQGAFIDIKSSYKNIGQSSGFLLDIGFNTLIAVPFKEGKILPSFKQYERFGISGLLEEFLSPILKSSKNLNIKDINKLNEAYMKGFIKVGFGEKINIESEIKTAVENYMEIILQKIKEDFIEELADMETLILTGGGSYRLKDFLPDNIKKITIIPELPEFSNTRGYFKIVQNLLSSN